MKILARVLAVLLTTAVIAISVAAATSSSGYGIILFFPLVTTLVIAGTLVNQLFLFLLVRSAKKTAYDFFYCSAFTASILLIGFYVAYVKILGRVNEHVSGHMSVSSDSSYGTASEGTPLSFLGMHLLALLPIVLQVVLAVRRKKQIALETPQ